MYGSSKWKMCVYLFVCFLFGLFLTNSPSLCRNVVSLCRSTWPDSLSSLMMSWTVVPSLTGLRWVPSFLTGATRNQSDENQHQSWLAYTSFPALNACWLFPCTYCSMAAFLPMLRTLGPFSQPLHCPVVSLPTRNVDMWLYIFPRFSLVLCSHTLNTNKCLHVFPLFWPFSRAFILIRACLFSRTFHWCLFPRSLHWYMVSLLLTSCVVFYALNIQI